SAVANRRINDYPTEAKAAGGPYSQPAPYPAGWGRQSNQYISQTSGSLRLRRSISPPRRSLRRHLRSVVSTSGHQLLLTIRIPVDLRQVPLVMVNYPLVHGLVPPLGQVRGQQHRRIATWQLRRLLEMPQRLITPGRVGVVVRMAL